MHWMNWFGGHGFGMIFWWVLLIVGVVLLVKWVGGQQERSIQQDGPVEILKKRYARGELSKKEFEETKKDLV